MFFCICFSAITCMHVVGSLRKWLVQVVGESACYEWPSYVRGYHEYKSVFWSPTQGRRNRSGCSGFGPTNILSSNNLKKKTKKNTYRNVDLYRYRSSRAVVVKCHFHPFHTERLIRIEIQINVGFCVHTATIMRI